jgi:hypothetical protein
VLAVIISTRRQPGDTLSIRITSSYSLRSAIVSTTVASASIFVKLAVLAEPTLVSLTRTTTATRRPEHSRVSPKSPSGGDHLSRIVGIESRAELLVLPRQPARVGVLKFHDARSHYRRDMQHAAAWGVGSPAASTVSSRTSGQNSLAVRQRVGSSLQNEFQLTGIRLIANDTFLVPAVVLLVSLHGNLSQRILLLAAWPRGGGARPRQAAASSRRAQGRPLRCRR